VRPFLLQTLDELGRLSPYRRALLRGGGFGMDDETKERGFKIHDKRRFDASGQPRETGEEQEETATETATSATKPPPERVAQDTGKASSLERPAGGGKASAGSATGSEGSGRTRGELTFSSFVVGLATQAFTFLGAAPDPASGVVRQDLAQAAAMIQILAMLREKTAGNLADDESHLIEEVLYELKMQYVAATRHPTNPSGDPNES
jgi:hypothetical protein